VVSDIPVKSRVLDQSVMLVGKRSYLECISLYSLIHGAYLNLFSYSSSIDFSTGHVFCSTLSFFQVHPKIVTRGA
jgi:hypothetical protein